MARRCTEWGVQECRQPGGVPGSLSPGVYLVPVAVDGEPVAQVAHFLSRNEPEELGPDLEEAQVAHLSKPGMGGVTEAEKDERGGGSACSPGQRVMQLVGR